MCACTQAYVEANLLYVAAELRATIPEVAPLLPGASYLLWLDCSGLGFGSANELNEFMLSEVRAWPEWHTILVYTYIYTQTDRHTHTHIYVYIYVYIYIRIYMYICMYLYSMPFKFYLCTASFSATYTKKGNGDQTYIYIYI